jgi:hypothetical protein
MMRQGAALAALLALSASVAPAWVESVEFAWNALPRPLWERELAWLKNIGVRHVSLPPAQDVAELSDVIRILRTLDMEADLEGPVPHSLLPLTRTHGGPLTDALPAGAVRISALSADALTHSRKMLTSGKPAVIWTDVEETLTAAGQHHAGAVNFAGVETEATLPLRRNAQLSRYWGETFSTLHESPVAQPAPGIVVQQFVSAKGPSFVSLVNASGKAWTGDLKLPHLVIPNVTVTARNSAWLPVNVNLMAGPLCKECTAFAKSNRLVYATAELTAMEYENGILAMEFSAPAKGEVVLSLSRQPSGPLVAGGKPSEFDWDEKTQRVRLPIPAGTGNAHHVRIGLAIEAPDATAFFTSAHVLLIGETNRLTAEFSSEAIAQRSRLRTAPELSYTQEPTKEPLQFVYNIKVPETAIHGDHVDLSMEADGARMSHARPQLLRPATLRFTDAVAVRMATNSAMPLVPAVVAVNQRSGRDVTVSLRNNAPEIRNFHLELKAGGLEFSPASMDVTVGASVTRELSFRVFATGAEPGLHVGEARLSGAAAVVEPVRFLVVPAGDSVTWSADGFSFLENAKMRASFLPGRWLEFLNKDNAQSAVPAGGVVFTGPGVKSLKMADLDAMLAKGKR